MLETARTPDVESLAPSLAQWNLQGLAIDTTWRATKRAWATKILKGHIAPALILAFLIFTIPFGANEFLVLLLVFAYVIVILLKINTGWKELKLATAHETDLLLDSTEEESCVVEIAVVQDGHVTGRDRGILWADGGKLGFHGHRASFALTEEIIDGLPSGYVRTMDHETFDGRLSHGVEIIPLVNDSRKVSVWVMPLTLPGAGNSQVQLQAAQTRLSQIIRGFVLNRNLAAENSFVYPPLAIQPNERTRHTLCAIPGVCFFSLGILALVVPPLMVFWGGHNLDVATFVILDVVLLGVVYQGAISMIRYRSFLKLARALAAEHLAPAHHLPSPTRQES